VCRVSATGTDPPGFFELIAFVVFGAFGGELWAAWKLDRAYQRLYKRRVLPLLAGQLDDLTYREASPIAGSRCRSSKRA
jgi:hypothetical protein